MAGKVGSRGAGGVGRERDAFVADSEVGDGAEGAGFVGGADGVGDGVSGDAAGGDAGVVGAEGVGDLLHREAEGVEFGGVDVDYYLFGGAALDGDAVDAVDFFEAGDEEVVEEALQCDDVAAAGDGDLHNGEYVVVDAGDEGVEDGVGELDAVDAAFDGAGGVLHIGAEAEGGDDGGDALLGGGLGFGEVVDAGDGGGDGFGDCAVYGFGVGAGVGGGDKDGGEFDVGKEFPFELVIDIDAGAHNEDYDQQRDGAAPQGQSGDEGQGVSSG